MLALPMRPVVKLLRLLRRSPEHVAIFSPALVKEDQVLIGTSQKSDR